LAPTRLRAFNLGRLDPRIWVAVAAVLVLVAPLCLVPSLLRSRAEAALHDRIGLAAHIDAASFGMSGATLRGVHLTPPAGEGVRIDVREVDARFGWWSALLHGSDALTQITATGVDAEIDSESQAFTDLKAKLRGKTGEKNASSGTHAARSVGVSDFAFELREGDQEVLSASGGKAQLSASQITAELESVRAIKPGLAVADMKDLTATVTREQGELRLSQVRVGEADISIEIPVVLLGGAKAAAPKPADDDNDDAATSDESAAQPIAAAPEPESGTKLKSLQALLARFEPDASIELERGHFEQVVKGQPNIPILNDVACRLELQPGGALHITGKGSAAATGGSLNADMRFWPAELRADGHVSMSALPLTLFVPVLPSVPWYEPETSRLHAELTIKAESPARVSLDGYADIRNVGLSADRLASTPVQNISMSLAGRGHWLPIARRLEIDTGSVGLGRAKADVKGAVEWAADHYAFDLVTNLPATPCTEAVRSIPAALLGDMALAEWRGNIAGKLLFHTDSRELDKTELKINFSDKCDFQVVPVIADLSRFARPFVHSVTEPDGTVFEMETGPGTPNWTSIEAMSPYFVHAVLVHEDPQFFNHHGFSPISIRNALVKDLRDRRYAVGASTISMQLVKNVFLHREKTLARKIQEVLLTWWTERVMDKRDILELYLNVIEYGPSIYGIRAAAQHYWNRLPSELSPAEGVFLATILPNPKKFHNYYTRNAVPASWASNMRKFLNRLGDRGAYDKEATDYGLQELEHFKFAREGQAAAPRVIAGTTAPLPYQREFKQDTYDANTFGAGPRGWD
jgi:hypothetical protein